MLAPTRIVARGARGCAARVSQSSSTSSAAAPVATRALQANAYHSGNSRAKKTPRENTTAFRRWPKHEIPDNVANRLVHDPKTPHGGPITVAWTSEYLFVQDSQDKGRRALKPATLRDSCTCAQCKDASSGQKSFASTEIPTDIGIESVRATDEGLAIKFLRDIERFAAGGHEMVLPWESVEMALKRRGLEDMNIPRKRSVLRRTGVQYWDKHTLRNQVRKIDYEEYMQGGEAFWHAVIDVCRFGIVYLKNVPQDEDAVVRITTRMANIRETFYGRTFDVRAKPNAENVAYTSGYLGLHQDLLYLEPPPMIQVLHCMENSCSGGESLFSDGERVGRLLWPFTHASRKMAPLREHFIPYQYDKHGHHYFSSRYVLDHNAGGFAGVYWSPPFQGKYLAAAKDLKHWIEPARIFEGLINAHDAVYEEKMAPGECVIFDNLRVMHGRKAFDAAGGSRWLRGAYIAGEDFLSRAAHIPAGMAEALRGDEPWTADGEQARLRGTKWHADVEDLVRGIDADYERLGEATGYSR